MKAVIDRFLRLHNGLWVRRQVRTFLCDKSVFFTISGLIVFLPLQGSG